MTNIAKKTKDKTAIITGEDWFENPDNIVRKISNIIRNNPQRKLYCGASSGDAEDIFVSAGSKKEATLRIKRLAAKFGQSIDDEDVHLCSD